MAIRTVQQVFSHGLAAASSLTTPLYVCALLLAAFRIERRWVGLVHWCDRFLVAAVVSTAVFALAAQLAVLVPDFRRGVLVTAVGLLALAGGARPVKRSPDRHPADRTLVLLLAGTVALLFALRLGPPLSNDDLTYHLAFPAHWIGHGTLATPWQPFGDTAPTFYPLVSLLVNTGLLLIQGGSDFWARCAATLYVPVLLAALLSLRRSIHARGPRVVLALVLASVPFLRAQSAGNDVPMAALATSAIALSLLRGREPRRRAMPVVVLAWILVAGTKYIGLALALAIPPLLWFAFGARGQRRPPHRRRRSGAAAIAALVGILPAGYGYARNLWETGAPLYPASSETAHAIWATSAHALPHGRELARRLGWPVVLAFPAAFLPGVFGARRSRRARGVLALCVAASACVYLVLPYRYPRFLLTSVVLALPLAAAPIPRLPARWRWRHPTVSSAGASLARAFAVLAVIAAAATAPAYEALRYESWAQNPVAGLRLGAAWDFLARQREGIGRPLRVATSQTHNLPYPLYGPHLDNDVRAIVVGADAADQVFDFGRPVPTGHAPSSSSDWCLSARVQRVDFVLTTRLAIERTFTVEDLYAQECPDLELVFEDPWAHLYRRVRQQI